MRRRGLAGAAVVLALLSSCGSTRRAAPALPTSPASQTTDTTAVARSVPATTRPTPATRPTTTTAAPVAAVATGDAPALPGSLHGGPGTFAPTAGGPLTGKTVAIDPGHNGANFSHPDYINAPIFNGREQEACDTTGTATDGGYTEAQFNFDVAEYLAADLRAEGATVVLTRTSNTGVGPCVTQRAAIGNAAHANAAISIHADGGPVSGYGFAILEPVADGINDAIIGPSQVLGADLRNAFAAGTGEAVSTYDGVDGIQPRDDLGGANLSTVPKVFIECANMRSPVDAQKVVSLAWQVNAARAVAAGLTAFLT